MRSSSLALPLFALLPVLPLLSLAPGVAEGQPTRRGPARADSLRGSAQARDTATARRTVAEAALERSGAGRRARAKGAAVLAGYVRDSLGRAIPFAQVLMDEYDGATVTNDTGYFRLERVPSGVVRFTAHRLDYQPISFEIDMPAGLAVNVDVRLRGGVAAVREVASRDSAAPSARLVSSGFFQRASLRNGYFFSPTDVELMNGYTHVAYLLRQVPGFTVEESPDGNAVTLKGRTCLRYYVDDVEMEALPDSLSPLQVLAIEAYPAFATTPTRFRPANVRECGVVAVWTKLAKPHGRK